MADYRRTRVPGACYFFTVVTHERQRTFADAEACHWLGRVMRRCQDMWPFETNAIVLLPDHLHAIWTMPPGSSNYSARWSWIKKEFSKEWLARGHSALDVSESARRQNRTGVWQRRFWEHMIRDDRDFERHFDYIHYNPVKHKLVRYPHEWKWSSFDR